MNSIGRYPDLDEPLGALDPMIRHGLQEELHALFERLRKTVVIVTHDMAEAAFFANRLVLMRAGRIVQEGTYRDLATDARRRNSSASSCARNAACMGCPAMLRAAVIVVAMIVPGVAAAELVIGSKVFTESVFSARSAHSWRAIPARRRSIVARLVGHACSGARWSAAISIVIRSTAALLRAEIFSQQSITDDAQLRAALTRAMPGPRSRSVSTTRTSLACAVSARVSSGSSGCRNSPRIRSCGWDSATSSWTRRRLARPARALSADARDVRGLNHDLAYRALADGALDVTDLYSTDAEIVQYDIVALADDAHYFPVYDALFVCRDDVAASRARDPGPSRRPHRCS